MSLANALADPLRQSRPVKVLDRSITKGRLAHGILLHGNDLEVIEEVGLALASVLLKPSREVSLHPDFFALRPTHKARQIRIGNTRELIRQIQHSPHQGENKVALVHEADRMNRESANAFLKTLEEPPTNTTIILLSTRPYALLDTIRSRCFNFHIPSQLNRSRDAGWQSWLEDYRHWLVQLRSEVRSAQDKADLVLAAYGLVRRYQCIIKEYSGPIGKNEKDLIPQHLDDEEKEAYEIGMRKRIRQQLIIELEIITRDFAIESIKGSEPFPTRQFARAIAYLEHSAGLLEVNLNEGAAMEYFFLNSLRIWAK